jgi:malonyl-CoA O-methyltransferase
MTARRVDKTALARSFSNAAGHYDAWAVAQAEIAAGLVRRLPEAVPVTSMVDLGCGSGMLSALLLDRYPQARLLGLDMAEGMVVACRKRWSETARARFVVGDAEDARCVEQGVDLVASSCVAHWFSDPERTLRMWGGALKPGGLLACAFLIAGSFRELEEAYRDALGREFDGLHFWDAETACRFAVSDELTLLRCEEERVVARYDSALDALRSFQRIGAVFRGQADYLALSPAQTRRLLACYGQQADGEGRVPVTHRVLFLVAEKSR